MTWAGLLNRRDVLVLDTETTGLTQRSEVIDLAVIDTTGKQRLDTFVMPVDPIPREASEVHGLTRAVLREANAPAWPDVHDRFVNLLASAQVVVIYNSIFDERLLRQTADRHRLTIPSYRSKLRCAMLEYAAHRRVPGPYGDWRWHKLTAAAQHEGVPIRNAHRALGDAKLTLALMRSLVAKRQAMNAYGG